jgi:hypothetical protein
MARVRSVLSKQGTDLAPMLNEIAGEHATHYLGVLIAESNLDEQAWRYTKWPDCSAGLSQVIAPNLGYGTYQRIASDAELEQYKAYMFQPENAMWEGWKYYAAALARMNDPLWAALSYNRGPRWTILELQEQVARDPAIARRLTRYRESLETAEGYAIVLDRFAVGPGVLAAMEAVGDEPRSDEEYIRPNISETYGKEAIYYYYAEDNTTRRLPFTQT